VSPVLPQRDGIGESMILSHAVTSTGVLRASNGLGEGDVHDVGVQVSEGDRGFNPVITSRRIGKNNVLGDVRGVGSHFDKPKDR
jgi:hypothetical protein